MIYLDLDGVFADFFGKLESLGLDYHADPRAAWSVAEKIPNFFATLQPTEYAVEMFNRIKFMANKSGHEITFLTALPLLTEELRTAAEDKKYWVQRVLHTSKRVICVSHWSEKSAYANGTDSILIDDSARNIIDWCGAGGVGIVHYNQPNTIKTLELILAA